MILLQLLSAAADCAGSNPEEEEEEEEEQSSGCVGACLGLWKMSRTVSAVCLSARMRVSAAEKESDGRRRALFLRWKKANLVM